MGSHGVYWILGLLALASFVGIPVAFAFAFASAVGLYFSLGGLAPVLALLQQTMLDGVREYNFVVLPLFTVMGLLIAHSGAAADLFGVVNRRLTGVPGRLAVATVGGNAVFAAVTGVGIASAAAFSQVAYPQMRRAGYAPSFATGCIAGSSVLGLLIPPSVFMIVWAILTEQSVGKLFAGGVLPGLLLASLYAAYCMLAATAWPRLAPPLPPAAADAASRDAAVRRSERVGWIGVTLLIGVTLGGIWLGFVTPTEGSALGLLGALLLALAKGMPARSLAQSFVAAGKTTTPVLLLLLCATMYTKLLALEGVPDQVRALLEALGLGPAGTVLFMVGTWFLLGCLIDSISIMLLTVPIFWPIAQALGIEPITFALVGILVIEAGVLTPPFGIGVFVVKAAVPDASVRVNDIFVGAAPYWLLILATAAAVWFWPPLATWLPSRL